VSFSVATETSFSKWIKTCEPTKRIPETDTLLENLDGWFPQLQQAARVINTEVDTGTLSPAYLD
jgi:hypothetical protein